jgi:queuine tRNA-ribosyltransferase
MSSGRQRSKKRREEQKPIYVEAPKTIDYSNFDFTIQHTSKTSKAQVGTLKTPHGSIQTPNFIFCGTKASIKNLTPDAMREAQTDIILANTYHCMIQPGADLVEKMGGLHEFMQWDGPMMTDSGGFQIFSMGFGSIADEIKGRGKSREKSILKITEDGARFRSYWDGTEINLTPELSIDVQRKLGADLIYQLDECTAYHHDKAYTESSMHRSHRWGDRCLVEFDKHNDGKQALYGIVQGGIYKDLRDLSVQHLHERPYFGTAIGGCLGATDEEMCEIVSWCMEDVPQGRPVHLLGIGRIQDVFSFVRLGITTFDCVSPTRIARHGWALMKGTPDQKLNLRNAQFKDDADPIDARIDCSASQNYSRAYIHHLLKSGELLGLQLLSLHNVAVMNTLMREIREAIKTDTLDELEKEWIPS